MRERLIHRAMGGLQNVDGVYGLGVDESDSELDGAAGGQPFKKAFALDSRQLLGVVESGEFGGGRSLFPDRHRDRRRTLPKSRHPGPRRRAAGR